MCLSACCFSRREVAFSLANSEVSKFDLPGLASTVPTDVLKSTHPTNRLHIASITCPHDQHHLFLACEHAICRMHKLSQRSCGGPSSQPPNPKNVWVNKNRPPPKQKRFEGGEHRNHSNKFGLKVEEKNDTPTPTLRLPLGLARCVSALGPAPAKRSRPEAGALRVSNPTFE